MSDEQTYIVINDDGFAGNHETGAHILALENTADYNDVMDTLETIERIDIDFPSFADGRGFSMAMDFRRAGYKGGLRAVGHLISDQYAHARRCGFDDVAISQRSAKRQAEYQWLEQVAHIDTTYQRRLHQAALAV